jgi:hypothetical protein
MSTVKTQTVKHGSTWVEDANSHQLLDGKDVKIDGDQVAVTGRH